MGVSAHRLSQRAGIPAEYFQGAYMRARLATANAAKKMIPSWGFKSGVIEQRELEAILRYLSEHPIPVRDQKRSEVSPPRLTAEQLRQTIEALQCLEAQVPDED